MADPWNLTADEWSKVLGGETDVKEAAERVIQDNYLPWNEVLQRYTEDSTTTLDLGSGRGENSAMLALRGKQTTLFDWSAGNITFSQKLFASINKPAIFVQGDMTKPLEFKDNQFDTVFSCGVFEYFTDDQIKGILKEAFRIAKKRVIIMVPNAWSIPYQIGMWYLKIKKQWQWGGEKPMASLKHCFKVIPNIKVTEFSVGTKHSLEFFNSLPNGNFYKRVCNKLFNLKHHSKPSRMNQGYLLITIGEKV